MDLKALKTFHLIVKHGSFIRAAQEMNYVQSTVTMQIQKLESELDIQLIERGDRGKKIRLTESGRLFYEQSLPIVKNIEQLEMNLSDLKSGDSGHIRLGVTEPTASYRLPRITDKFLSQYPKIRISVEIATTSILTQNVLNGNLDLALCTTPDLGSDLYFEPLFKEDSVVLMPATHPLAKHAVIAPEDFQGHRLLITSEICPYRRKLEMILKESGNISIDSMEIGSMTALKYFVETGIGVAIVPKIVLNPVPAGTTVRALSDSLIHMTFGVLLKASCYPLKTASSKLFQLLKEELQKHDPME